jgi:hypothetical protein
MSQGSDGKEMYIAPKLEKQGNIKKMTFDAPGWSCSLGDSGSDDCSSDDD